MPDYSKIVGNDAKFEGITEMSVDVQLFNLRICRRVRRHGAIGSFVGIVRFIKALSFCISLKLSDNAVSILGIILSNKSFNA